MSNFIKYTIGLECWAGKRLSLVKVECSHLPNNLVELQAVSGHNLASLPKQYSTAITSAEWEDRPFDPYDDTVEAIWALKKLGLAPAALA